MIARRRGNVPMYMGVFRGGLSGFKPPNEFVPIIKA